MTKTQARSNRMLAVEKRKLDKLMADYVQSIGATRAGGGSYPWVLETPLGKLFISFEGDCLHCRFDDVQRAVATLGRQAMNPFSGKFNTYVFARETAETAFECEFKPHIERAWRKAGLLPATPGHPYVHQEPVFN